MIRNVTTDKSIEASISAAVKAQKDLERQKVLEEIAEAQARIAVTKAKGEADANRELNSSLSGNVLRYQQNEVMREFAKKSGNSTILLPTDAQPLVNVGR